jgi:hypothetical protein
LGIKYRLSADWALKAGSGIYYQYLYSGYDDDGGESIEPIWFYDDIYMVNSIYPPLQSAFLSVGSEYLFRKNGQVSLELYARDFRNIASWEGLGQGYSYGAELMVKKGSSWLGYYYSVTRYRFGQDWIYPFHDSRHNVNLAIALPFGKGWKITSAWVLNSGFPYKGIVGYYPYVGPSGWNSWIGIVDQSGNMRYPTYHRLDAGFSKEFTLFKKWKGCFYFQVINLYARKNVLRSYYSINPSSGEIYRHDIGMLPLPIPNFGIRIQI